MLAQARPIFRRESVSDQAQMAAIAAEAPPRKVANVEAALALARIGRVRQRRMAAVGRRQTPSTKTTISGGPLARSSARLRKGKSPQRAANATNRHRPMK